MDHHSFIKKHIGLLAVFMLCHAVFAQNVEKLGTVDLQYHEGRPIGVCPSGISIDEASGLFCLHEGLHDVMHVYDMNDNLKETGTRQVIDNIMAENYIFLKDYVIEYYDDVLDIRHFDKDIIDVSTDKSNRNRNGISFILKKGDGYIVYYVDENGYAHAIDTDGNYYPPYQAMEYLKNTYPEQYERDMELSKKYSLFNAFCSGRALIWKGTYYADLGTLDEYWGERISQYLSGSKPIYWDEDGNGSQLYITKYDQEGYLNVNSGDGRTFVERLDVIKHSKVLQRYMESGLNDTDYYYSSAMYSGFGGDIYFYFAGEGEDTELFRVRRTWGNPNLYSIAVNGWTDDDYGSYVDEVLQNMDKKELRLLRNTVYALYGYHFNSQDLKDYFGEKVWYEDKGTKADGMKLVPSRQALIDRIKALEDK